MRDDIALAVRQRDLASILQLMFEGDLPSLRRGFRTETDLWDFKRDSPYLGRDSELAWAELAKDVLAFHNNRGGLLFFGITDEFQFVGATPMLDSKLVNDRLRKYLPDSIWVEYSREFIQANQRYLGVALVPPRGPVPQRFRTSAPVRGDGSRPFQKRGTALRKNDSTCVMSEPEADAWIRGLRIPVAGQVFAVNHEGFRILAPDYQRFVHRRVCDLVEASLRDPRIAVTSLIGVGGMGKTAIATWAVNRAYDDEVFEFIVSITAKDRELTQAGIVGLTPRLTSFETLLDEILEVTGFPEEKALPIGKKEESVRALLEDSGGLLYVDNLETVDDARIIEFLDSLPIGVKAVVTSRRVKVRVAAQPIQVPPMSGSDAIDFVRSIEDGESFSQIAGLSDTEIQEIASAWDGIPLAIKWALSRSANKSQAVESARAAASLGLRSEELLEFSFRRVFDSLTDAERAVLSILGAVQQPLPIEALIVASGITQCQVLDAEECLEQDAIVQREFDTSKNDYTYTVMPTTRAFIEHSFSDAPEVAERIRRDLSNWYRAADITDETQRLLVSELRQGRSPEESALVDLGVAARRRGDKDSAERLLTDALARNPRSWRAARELAEFQRHDNGNRTAALRLYEQAASHAPARGADRALIHREWAMLLRDSGLPDGPLLAEEKLRVALEETPNDAVALGALAVLLSRRGAHRLVVELLEPHRGNRSTRFRTKALPFLLKAYDALNEIGKAAELRRELREDGSII